MPKVKFGFKNCYYAKITDVGGTISYGNPKQLKGAVSMSLSASGETTEFYADDSLYFSDENNNGYEGTLELALIPEDFAKDCLGYTLDANNVLSENANNVTTPFALLCEFTADDGAIKYAFYNCQATRPDLNGNTKAETKDVQTETLNIKIRPRGDGLVLNHTTATTGSQTTDAWYTTVYEPSDSQ